MKTSILVLENQGGQILRTYKWKSPKIKIIRRRDTNRIEALADAKELKNLGVEFEVVVEANISQLHKRPVKVDGIGQLRYLEVDSSSAVVKDVQLPKEDEGRFKHILQWTTAVHFALLGLLLVVGLLVLPMFQEEEHVIEIVKKERVEKKLVKRQPRQVVKASNTKVKRKKVSKRRVTAKKVVSKKKPVKTYAKAKTTKRAKVATKKAVDVNSLGALGALGGTANGRRGSVGLNVKAVKTSQGSGFTNGASGRGGATGVIASQGLVSKGVGAGKGAGVGHTGTRGRGGGQSGYGKMGLAGASQNYSYPISDEAMVHGGLDRQQVDAVIKKHLGEVTYCYEKGLQKEPDLRGRVAVSFVISGHGKVATARVANTSLQSEVVESCLVKRLRNWKFPKPVGNVDVRVSYPFMMKRTGHG